MTLLSHEHACIADPLNAPLSLLQWKRYFTWHTAVRVPYMLTVAATNGILLCAPMLLRCQEKVSQRIVSRGSNRWQLQRQLNPSDTMHGNYPEHNIKLQQSSKHSKETDSLYFVSPYDRQQTMLQAIEASPVPYVCRMTVRRGTACVVARHLSQRWIGRYGS